MRVHTYRIDVWFGICNTVWRGIQVLALRGCVVSFVPLGYPHRFHYQCGVMTEGKGQSLVGYLYTAQWRQPLPV